MADITKILVEHNVIGSKNGAQVFKHSLNYSTGVLRFAEGDGRVADGVRTRFSIPRLSNSPRIMRFECAVACTVWLNNNAASVCTIQSSGFGLVRLRRALFGVNSITNIAVKQSSGVAVDFSWGFYE